jgi:hypothetical protein
MDMGVGVGVGVVGEGGGWGGGDLSLMQHRYIKMVDKRIFSLGQKNENDSLLLQETEGRHVFDHHSITVTAHENSPRDYYDHTLSIAHIAFSL